MYRSKSRCASAATALVLALVFGGYGHAEERGNTCARSLAACPDRGCAEEGSDDALINETKRRLPRGRTPIRLSLDDFLTLQDKATDLVGQKVSLNRAGRNKLRDLEVGPSDRKVSEGDLVELVGFIIGLPNRPKASGPEGVNCRLSGSANNDIHIPVGENPEDTEFEGIVVEMIPQDRDAGWTVKRLKRIAREKRLVVIRGALFYDNKHHVNDDPDDVRGGDPKRASLWEIHPVTEVIVCMTASRKCNRKNLKSQQWVGLEKLKD